MAQASKRMSGAVKWFDGQKGFGFITPDGGGDDLFVHQSAIRSDGFRALAEANLVEFAVDRADDGRIKAVDVTGPNGRGFTGGRGFRGGGGGGGYGRGGRAGGRGGRFGGGYGGACFNCGRSGHLAKDCYQGGGGDTGGRFAGGGGGTGGRYGGGTGGRYGGGTGGNGNGGRYGGGGYSGGGCYKCGEHGHFARDCPTVEQ